MPLEAGRQEPLAARSLAQARAWFDEFPRAELRLIGADGHQAVVVQYLAALAWFDQHGEPDAYDPDDDGAGL
jgi:hypothetical protein